MNAQSLVKIYEYNAEVIQTQMDDITHKESLVQPVDGSHSINWLLGHIISARSIPLQRVGAKQVWDETSRARYRNNSAPINKDEEHVLHIDDLVSLFNQTQNRLLAGLTAMTPDDLASPSGYGTNSIYESFQYFHFHEAYHTGQLTMVAAYLGRPTAYLDLS
jgi:uncharacterized damage-inducible protein DinB